MYQRKLDLHVHTDNSPDGNHSAMFLCERAELAGMRAIALTDREMERLRAAIARMQDKKKADAPARTPGAE